MLSGGERALTAVALLFAMLEVRPVPFCVLDEVDAALDEANIGRFADALRSLAHGTQFIVITHNRGHDRGGRRALRRHRRRRLGQPGHQPPARRGTGARRARSGPNGAGRVGFAACPSGDAVTTRRRPEREVDEPVDPDFVDPSWEPDPADFEDGADTTDAPTAPDEPEPTAERVDPLLPFDPPPPTVVTIEMPTPVPPAAGRPRRHGPEPVRRPNRRSLPLAPAAVASRAAARRHRGRPRRRPRADPRRLHVTAPRRPGDRRDRRPVLGRRRGDADRRRRRGRARHGHRRTRAPESARPGRRRGRDPRRARGPARRRAISLGAALADRRRPGGRPGRRRQRDGQDHDDRQARQPLHGRGPVRSSSPPPTRSAPPRSTSS